MRKMRGGGWPSEMIAPGYTIQVDPDRALLTIQPTGLWDVALLARHSDDFQRSVEACGGRPYRILVDLRDFAVQPKLVNAALQHFVARQASLRTAMILSGSVLQRLQLQRLTSVNPAVRAFGPEEMADAHGWLFARDEWAHGVLGRACA